MALNKVEICGVNTANLPLLSEKEKKELEGEHLSPEVEALMEKRGTFVVKDVHEELPLVTKDWTSDHKGAVLSTIICNGDCQGAVIVVSKSDNPQKLETFQMLTQSAASFMGKHMEQ